jgi:hypothetical protein
MAGILSALGNTLNIMEVFSESDGSAKGFVKALRGKKVRLLRADGSLLKLINKYVVEPVLVIDNSLKNVEELDKAIALHVDMFTGFYMQAFEILTNIEGTSSNIAIDTLATDNGGLERALLSGADWALENREPDYISELFSGNLSFGNEDARDDLETQINNSIFTMLNGINDPDLREKMIKKVYETNISSEIAAKLASNKNYNKAKAVNDAEVAVAVQKALKEHELYDQVSIDLKEQNIKDDDDKRDKDTKSRKDVEEVKHKFKLDQMTKQQKLDIHKGRMLTTKEGAKAGLGRGAKELFVPEAIIRNVELTMTSTIKEGRDAGREINIVIPVTIKANILFTDVENIVNAIDSSGDDYTFSSRWDEYRSGGISLGDFIFATDLIKKYKKNRLKDKNGLMELINARTLSANSKMIDNGFAGFEKYYNMVIINSENLPALEKNLRGKLHSS